MPTTENYHQKNKGIFALFKGKPGKGKSVAALSFPTPYVFDFDRKMPAVSLKHYPEKKVDWNSFKDIFELRDKLESFINSCPYETLIFDSVTSLSTLCLNSIGKTKGEKVIDMLQKPIKTKSGEINVDVMGIDYYNGEANFFERFLVEIAGILYAKEGNPKHIIFLAHILTVESAPNVMKNMQVTSTSSIVTAGRKAAVMIEKAFDENYTFNIQTPSAFDDNAKVKFLCNTQSYGEDMCRTSYRLDPTIDFTNKNFYDMIKESCKFE